MWEITPIRTRLAFSSSSVSCTPEYTSRRSTEPSGSETITSPSVPPMSKKAVFGGICLMVDLTANQVTGKDYEYVTDTSQAMLSIVIGSHQGPEVVSLC